MHTFCLLYSSHISCWDKGLGSRWRWGLIGQLSLLLVPNMVLSKMNNHEHRTKQTYGGAQAKMSTWFRKPNQSLISKVTKKRVEFNLKIFVFSLLKTVHCRAERNPGRIGRIFNCNDRCFFIWREAPKPKCLPGLVSPIKV